MPVSDQAVIRENRSVRKTYLPEVVGEGEVDGRPVFEVECPQCGNAQNVPTHKAESDFHYYCGCGFRGEVRICPQ